MKKLRLISIIVAMTMIAVSFFFRSALSVATGALIAIASFELLYLIISRAFGTVGKSMTMLVIAALMKFALLGFVLWFVVVRTPINPVAFLIGLSTIVISIVIYGILRKLYECF